MVVDTIVVWEVEIFDDIKMLKNELVDNSREVLHERESREYEAVLMMRIENFRLRNDSNVIRWHQMVNQMGQINMEDQRVNTAESSGLLQY